MKEIEILVRVNEPIEKAIKKLQSFDYIGTSNTIDTYYYDPLRSELKPNDDYEIKECLRTRVNNGRNTLAYKVDKFDENGKWLYSDEYETKFNSLNDMNKIIEKIGLKELIKINNTKRVYKSGEYEIVLEDVEDLGGFLEVEYCTDEEVDVANIKLKIQEFIDKLGIDVSEDLKVGKPEMMLRLKKIYLK